MEHRYQRRLPARFDVELWFGDNHVGCGRVRNVSPEGMFVETRPTTLREQDFIKIEMSTGPVAGTRCSVTGLVCHVSTDGVGVMLTESISHLLEGMGSADFRSVA